MVDSMEGRLSKAERPSEARGSGASGLWSSGMWEWRASDVVGYNSPAPQEKAQEPPSQRSSIDAAEESAASHAPLCPLLLVPEGTRLNCIVECDLSRRRQEMSFNIRGVGGAHLFQVRVAELGNSTPGIFMETLTGEALLAFVSTEEIWRGVPRPTIKFFWPSGVQYGTMQKNEEGHYSVQQAGALIMTFSGNFAQHAVKVKNGQGRTVASITQDSSDEYQVVVHTCNDAGLVILAALAIDKCELDAADQDESSMGTSVSDVGVLFGENFRDEMGRSSISR